MGIFFTFWEISILPSIEAEPDDISASNKWGLIFIASPPTLIVPCHISHFHLWKISHNFVFVTDNSDFECFFICLLAICICPVQQSMFISFPFLTVVLLLLSFMNILHKSFILFITCKCLLPLVIENFYFSQSFLLPCKRLLICYNSVCFCLVTFAKTITSFKTVLKVVS